jgi:hypothetical protein
VNCTEDVTVELTGDGMVVHHPTSPDVKTEHYVIPYASFFTDDSQRDSRSVPLLHLWLIWLGSLPLLAALIYLSVYFL